MWEDLQKTGRDPPAGAGKFSPVGESQTDLWQGAGPSGQTRRTHEADPPSGTGMAGIRWTGSAPGGLCGVVKRPGTDQRRDQGAGWGGRKSAPSVGRDEKRAGGTVRGRGTKGAAVPAKRDLWGAWESLWESGRDPASGTKKYSAAERVGTGIPRRGAKREPAWRDPKADRTAGTGTPPIRRTGAKGQCAPKTGRGSKEQPKRTR